jgi:arylformamidase
MTIWPGDSSVELKRDLSIKSGDACNLSSISMGLHTGTHVDSPLHFVEDGAAIPSVDLTRFLGPAKVFEINCEKAISIADMQGLSINENDIVIFKTSNSDLPESAEFEKDFVFIDQSAADFLVNKKIKTVGVDYLSVESYDAPEALTHRVLLSANIGIIENLCLKDVQPGEYFLSCPPLKIEGAEGSPVRAVLMELED